MHLIMDTGTSHFNSQPHKEADRFATGRAMHTGISIHSLTRRLTDAERNIVDLEIHFNSQPHKEADKREKGRGF